MAFNPSSISPDDIIEVGGGKRYPFFQWVSKAQGGALTKGGFLFKSDQPTGDFVFPAQPETVTIINGPTLEGYTFKGLHVAMLGLRQDWYYQNVNVSNKKTFADSYDAALALANGQAQFVRGRTQILALVKQVAPWYGPVLITSSGVVGRAFDNLVKQDWPNKFVNTIAKLYGRPSLPLWYFWMPITTTGVEVRASQRYSSTVVYPKLALPETITTESADKAYIGDELVEKVRAMLPEVRAWMTAKLTANLGEPVMAGNSGDTDGPTWGAPATGGAASASTARPFQRTGVEDIPWE